jgi:succinate dehydrogenase / fumarate reductase membrane anchor subunit
MRLSGLVLLFLAVGHVLIMHVLDEGVDRVDFAFIQLRWASLFWKTWDWLMLVLALLHGVNGLRMILLDYVRPAGVRRAINGFFVILGAALMALGTIIVVTFDPSKWPTS